ncbi:HNH endonuclease family protein [Glycomyces sp. L485]|uniref:HNH endonuclease family protein n=1 Tax=Glycomyces sp. L485 TaxID=2909235 RepID=UPI001F4A6D99|nr:HNH endonuclease family protein [Glycomyces sp. L485]MCH7231496.1 HNH endonuclease family protein [Glycomyces sp. L485]
MSTRSRLAAAVAAAALLPALASCEAVDDLLAEATETPADAPAASGDQSELMPFTVEVDAATLNAAIEALTVAEEADEGYDRSLFPHWNDLDGNGCNAREDTLVAEDRSGNLSDADCGEAMTGEWVSMYDGETVTASGDLDVDHFVPLKEAWGSGAHAWSTEEREAYANGLDQPWHLVAVTASSNRSKSDKDPADWMPELGEVACAYIWAWVQVKTEWDLSVDAAEAEALLGYAADC